MAGEQRRVAVYGKDGSLLGYKYVSATDEPVKLVSGEEVDKKAAEAKKAREEEDSKPRVSPILAASQAAKKKAAASASPSPTPR